MAITRFTRPYESSFVGLPFQEILTAGKLKQGSYDESEAGLNAIDDLFASVKALDSVYGRTDTGDFGRVAVSDKANVDADRRDYYAREKQLIDSVGGDLTDPRVKRFINSERSKMAEKLAPTGKYGQYTAAYEVDQKQQEAVSKASDVNKAYHLLGDVADRGEAYRDGKSQLIMGTIGKYVDYETEAKQMGELIKPELISVWANETNGGKQITSGYLRGITQEKILDTLGIDVVPDGNTNAYIPNVNGIFYGSEVNRDMLARRAEDVKRYGQDIADANYINNVSSFVSGMAKGLITSEGRKYLKDTALGTATKKKKADTKELKATKDTISIPSASYDEDKGRYVTTKRDNVNVERLSGVAGATLPSGIVGGEKEIIADYYVRDIVREPFEEEGVKKRRYWVIVEKRPYKIEYLDDEGDVLPEGQMSDRRRRVIDEKGYPVLDTKNVYEDVIPLDDTAINEIENQGYILPEDWKGKKSTITVRIKNGDVVTSSVDSDEKTEYDENL